MHITPTSISPASSALTAGNGSGGPNSTLPIGGVTQSAAGMATNGTSEPSGISHQQFLQNNATVMNAMRAANESGFNATTTPEPQLPRQQGVPTQAPTRRAPEPRAQTQRASTQSNQDPTNPHPSGARPKERSTRPTGSASGSQQTGGASSNPVGQQRSTRGPSRRQAEGFWPGTQEPNTPRSSTSRQGNRPTSEDTRQTGAQSRPTSSSQRDAGMTRHRGHRVARAADQAASNTSSTTTPAPTDSASGNTNATTATTASTVTPTSGTASNMTSTATTPATTTAQSWAAWAKSEPGIAWIATGTFFSLATLFGAGVAACIARGRCKDNQRANARAAAAEQRQQVAGLLLHEMAAAQVAAPQRRQYPEWLTQYYSPAELDGMNDQELRQTLLQIKAMLRSDK